MTRSNRAGSVLCLLLAAAPWAAAYNPILPLWEYIPDGEPRVFGDRLYLYGSHDRAGSKEYCDYQYRVWSAPLSHLTGWEDHGISLATRTVEGHADDVPWSDNHLYAPDVVEKGGRYWLYAYVVGAPLAVAVSDDPGGPFRLVSKLRAPEGAPAEFGGWGQYIDPGVLVDDDGRVYIYWGYKRSAMAELNAETMIDVLPGTLRSDIIPVEAPFNFFEGVSPRKIGGRYYLVYAAGDSLVYATSDRPTGPFAYGGAIIRNRGDNPGGNIHGGLVQVHGQWSITYHRHTHNTHFSRRACVERVTIAPDGSIAEVGQTSLGFRTSLDPLEEVPADVTCVLRGGAYVMEFDRDTRAVVNAKDGAVVGYKTFDFGTADGRPLDVCLTLRSAGESGTIEVWLGEPGSGRRIAAARVGPGSAGGGAAWHTVRAPVGVVSGRQDLYFRFTGRAGGGAVADLRSFRFEPASRQ